MGKQVKTPRFYVDIPTFLHATGQLGWDDTVDNNSKGGAELLYMNPSNPVLYENDEVQYGKSPFSIGNYTNEGNVSKTSFPINFCALLNHNLRNNRYGDAGDFRVIGHHNFPWDAVSQTQSPRLVPSSDGSVLNAEFFGELCQSLYNGTTIFTFNTLDHYWRSFTIYYGQSPAQNIEVGTHQLGSFVVGKYWDAPNSPDLNLTMSRRFDGIKKQKTIGGKTLANIYYDGPTEWTMYNENHIYSENNPYKYPPFELDRPDLLGDIGHTKGFNQKAKSGLGRKGLRSWKLTFSYIAESDMWMDNEVSNTLISDSETNTDDNDPNPMLSDDSFNFVWNCTLGGTLPFIFQPDNSSTGTNPDRFAICTFRENTLNVKQVAYNTYSLSITIDEVA